ncbi:MAG: prolyl oligopeptidase family serine peptidase, partial [Candidatus Marinimicrobia bacterium]|nr:prolyl oligopeptidase family serine peptidase [Candidatus Neomarinimicrobiota bacterium]
LVIMGGSYGGYMTNWVITQTNLFEVAASRYGIFDLKSDFSNSIYAQWELDYLGKPYWETPNLYRRMSPSTFIKKAKTPTLILHGAEDENTFTSNSRELARALKTLAVPHRFFLYPREGHGMDEPNHRLDVFQRQLSWVNYHLGRKAALSGEDWLSKDIQVQILSVNKKARFLNYPDETFLKIKLLIDGSQSINPHPFTLADFRLQPWSNKVLGLPSGQILLQDQNFRFELGPDTPSIELELIFQKTDDPDQELHIKGVGSFTIP